MMSFYQRGGEKRKNLQELQVKVEYMRSGSPKNPTLDLEKRQRREVANSNERRRMQSINAGFQSLRALIPHHQGDKLSKAAILQQTADYITSLEEDKNHLLSQNQRLKQMLLESNPSMRLSLPEQDLVPPASPQPKRQKRDTESSDEGISVGGDNEEHLPPHELRKELANTKKMLQLERKRRLVAEEERKELERGLHGTSSPPHVPLSPRAVQQVPVIQTIKEEPVILREECARPVKVEAMSSVAAKPVLDNSKSSRNMEILLEAFRLIEGDRALFDSKPSYQHLPANSEESEKESSSSEYEYDTIGSGRDSPVSRMSDSETTQSFSLTRSLPCRPESLSQHQIRHQSVTPLHHFRSVVAPNQS